MSAYAVSILKCVMHASLCITMHVVITSLGRSVVAICVSAYVQSAEALPMKADF